MENAARFLTHTKTSGLGSGYKASCEIPANTRIAVYTGTIKRADTRLGDHDIALGEHFASVPLVIDGAPPLKAEDAPPPGLMQLVNHACLVQEWSIPMSLPRANCLVDDAADLTCVLSGLPLIVLRTARVIRAGEELLFSYQLRVSATSFWREESSLPPPARGWTRVRCLCQAPAACPNKLARNERRQTRKRCRAEAKGLPSRPPSPLHLSPLSPSSPPPLCPPLPPPHSPSLPSTSSLPPLPPSSLPSLPSFRQRPLAHYFSALNRPIPFDPEPSSLGSPRVEEPAGKVQEMEASRETRRETSIRGGAAAGEAAGREEVGGGGPSPPASTHQSAPTLFSTVVCLNVGPIGLVEALPQLVGHFKDLPAVVMLQECRLPRHSLAALKREAHRLLPAYCVMAVRRESVRPDDRTALIQVVTMVHVHLGTRASLLDVKQQYASVADTAPDVLLRTHFIRLVEPRTNVSLLLANVYQYQAGEPLQQAACLSLITAVFTRWQEQSDCTLAGGDWNASVCPRVGYADSERIRHADGRLRAWSAASGLECCAPEAPTWHSFNDTRRAVLDCFFHKSRANRPCLEGASTFLSADPRHDHCGVRATLSVAGIGPMPSLEALRRPLRLKMKNWVSRRDEWRERVTQALQTAGPVADEDCFGQLERMRRVSVNCARTVLGVTGGDIRPIAPRQSPEFRKLRAQLSLLQVVRREIYQRQLAGAEQGRPSRAMRKAWDRGLYPEPATFAALSALWTPQFAAWTESWCRYLRQRIHTLTEQLQELRKDELTQQMARARSAAISRFWTNGELKRMLHPNPPGLHTPQISTAYPEAVLISGAASVLRHLASELSLLPFPVRASAGTLSVQGLGPSSLYRVLDLVSDKDLTIELSCRTRVVTSVEDRLGAFEVALAAEAAATKARCPRCLGSGCFLPVPTLRAGSRTVSTWCRTCSAYREPVIDPLLWADIPFCLSGIPRVPPDSGETLRGPITEDDFQYFVGQLPNNKASPDMLCNELVRHAPEEFKETILLCLNRILVEGAALPASWKGGLIRFLFKKGDVQDIACYRPVCLLDTIYKILSAVLTDRLYRLCERHGLLDPSQEGFRRLHSTQRQVQSLHWAWEEAAEQKKSLYVAYLDFEWAFNSIDLEALWRWLEELNVPDVDLLRRLYAGAYYEADLPYGRSAPIFLLRGKKQGDKPSPLLFGLIFNCLLLALLATGVGHNTISGLRAPSRGFADDLALTTELASGMSRLLEVVAAFCAWTGARVKLSKSVITAYDYQQRRELPTDTILYRGSPLVHLPADKSFPYLGVRASLVSSGSKRRAGPILAAEKEHVLAATKELAEIAREHSSRYLLSQMVPAMHMVATARFRYSAPLVPWTDAELNEVHRAWLRVDRASWRLPPGYPSAPLLLPEENGGCATAHPRVLLIQALATHIEQLVALPDQLRADTIARYHKLCDSCGCHTPRELAAALAEEGSPRKCPIARFLRACGQLGVRIRLPTCLSLGKTERETSWHCLLSHVRQLASSAEADDQLRQDVACVAASWGAIRRRFRRRGVRMPRQLVVAALSNRPATWTVPESLSRNPRWLGAFRRALARLDPGPIFPRLDRGEGVRAVSNDQALVQATLAGLGAGHATRAALFNDPRWDSVRSSCPLACWQQQLGRLGVVVPRPEGAACPRRSRAPVEDLLTLGRCTDTSVALLRRLCRWLAPSLCSVATDIPDGGPLTWAPVRLSTERITFTLDDQTAGVVVVGDYIARTKDGLVQVVRSDGYQVGTVHQGRWALLAGAYGAEAVCCTLQGWIPQVESDERRQGVGSQQFYNGLQGVLQAEIVVGCHPLVAPAVFPASFRNWTGLEGWGQELLGPTLKRVLYVLLALTPQEQLELCRGLSSDGVWFALTCKSNLDTALADRLRSLGSVVKVFRRGTLAAACKGSWRTGELRATKLRAGWTLWGSRNAAGSPQLRRELQRQLDMILLTRDGVTPLDPLSPSAKEATLGPAGAAYGLSGITVGVDGSCKGDGAMGAAMVPMGNRIQARSAAVFGSASSIRPELTGITMALEECPEGEDLNILTDSLSAMLLLKNLQRKDFPLSLYRHPVRQLLIYAVQLLNGRVAVGSVTRFLKVKSHRAEPLNTAADASASAAAELDPTRPVDLDPEAVYFYFRDTPVEWDARLKAHLVQVAASQRREALRQSSASGSLSLTASWMLRPLQGRGTLGAVLHALKPWAVKRRILQTVGNTFPCNAVLHRWQRTTSAGCLLCGHPAETVAHIQCMCPALKEARIRAHHNLADMLWQRVERLQSKWQVVRELTVSGLLGLSAPVDRRDEWCRVWDMLTEEDLDVTGDPVFLAGLLRKRPDAMAVHWSGRVLLLLEFTRAGDGREDWHTITDTYKLQRYQSVQGTLARHLPGWSVETLTFTIGTRGSYSEPVWQANLKRLGLSQAESAVLMRDLVTLCLQELEGLFRCRSAALQARHASGK